MLSKAQNYVRFMDYTGKEDFQMSKIAFSDPVCHTEKKKMLLKYSIVHFSENLHVDSSFNS